ncbi:hypothetical protein HZB02_01450 [Candidatus Woesearchaeota archaeon]|nr:hypothetical protein [Candidatus Woesearchaeota archaeon]
MSKRQEKKWLRWLHQDNRDALVPEVSVAPSSSSSFTGMKGFYLRYQKQIILVPIFLIIFSLLQLGFQWSTTGDILNKGVSLKGGVELTIPSHQVVDLKNIEQQLRVSFPRNDLTVRALKQVVTTVGFQVDIDIDGNNPQDRAKLIAVINNVLQTNLKEGDYTLNTMGPSLGASFFAEVRRAVLVAFLFMSTVIYLYFGDKGLFKWILPLISLADSLLLLEGKSLFTDIMGSVVFIAILVYFLRSSVPSFAVVIAALADILLTIAVVNLLGMKVSIAGVAAFLMLIGYSVDTDILLSTRVLKNKQGTMDERIFSSIKTGGLMSITTLITTFVGYFVAQSSVVKEIMIIICIGMVADMIMTWLLNAVMLRNYVLRKGTVQ